MLLACVCTSLPPTCIRVIFDMDILPMCSMIKAFPPVWIRSLALVSQQLLYQKEIGIPGIPITFSNNMVEVVAIKHSV